MGVPTPTPPSPPSPGITHLNSYHLCYFLERKVEVETNNNQTRRDIYNVIAVLKGSVEPGKLYHTSVIYTSIPKW